jgi:hypothetical protein
LNAAHALLSSLCREPDRARQRLLRGKVGQLSSFRHLDLVEVLRHNPFFELDPVDIGNIDSALDDPHPEWELLRNRQAAARSDGWRIGIFAMPKSGSSFASAAISSALGLRSFGLTSGAADTGSTASFFGINGREQELDELAIILQTLRGQGSWIAQHHTCFTPYFGLQLRFFGIRPVMMVRNIFDAIVSMDDMIVAWRKTGDWWGDPYSLPLDYHERERDLRLAILCQEFGIWLINFHLSWMRGLRLGLVDPLVLSYEEDILVPDRFVARVGEHFSMDDAQRDRLRGYVAAPDRNATRFNKGVAGRGNDIPEADRHRLIDHARLFADELGNVGMTRLFGAL